MIRSVLIANRGEIACRVIRTARQMGIRTIAVYSAADRDALHVREADEARFIGPAPAAESYLKSEAIISAAKGAGADAIHPGYGFLAENAAFADACAEAGVIFIGPSPDAIRTMGDKAAAKAVMEKAGVPVVPGYHGKDQKDATLRKAAEGIGWPVLLKASAGGGGKGMRVIRDVSSFADALASARREAKAAFGDDRMLVEKYIKRPRHIEVQIFGDGHGNVVHLYERDCSVQRRHQKVVEEAPAPGVSPEWRARICEAAVNAARTVKYTGAGTVEFIAEAGEDGTPGGFWFMEMNTRLQVEHPVTEAITGTDLVEWQFKVASGEALPLAQEAIPLAGHAVEVRLYAEDPSRDFLPAPGKVRYFDYPDGSGVRVDAGIGVGQSDVPPDYDPMIAKVIACADSREVAVAALAGALRETIVVGVTTNREFLSRILDHAEFRARAVDTGFVERNMDSLVLPSEPATGEVLALASLALLRQRHIAAAIDSRNSADPWSPWARTNGWRLNDTGHTVLRFIDGEGEIDVICQFRADGYRLELPDGGKHAAIRASSGDPGEAGAELIGGKNRVELDGMLLSSRVVRDGDVLHVFHDGGHWRLGVYDPLSAAASHEGASGGLAAPMPGKVTALHVKPGDAVSAGQPLMVVEAMKMEHTINAPANGRVAEVRFAAGDQVAEGEILIVVDEADED